MAPLPPNAHLLFLVDVRREILFMMLESRLISVGSFSRCSLLWRLSSDSSHDFTCNNQSHWLGFSVLFYTGFLAIKPNTEHGRRPFQLGMSRNYKIRRDIVGKPYHHFQCKIQSQLRLKETPGFVWGGYKDL